MKQILKYLPGLTGALCAYILLKFITWTEMSYEFAIFVVTYLVVTVLMESAMKSYGNKL